VGARTELGVIEAVFTLSALVFGVGLALAIFGGLFEGPVQRYLERRFSREH